MKKIIFLFIISILMLNTYAGWYERTSYSSSALFCVSEYRTTWVGSQCAWFCGANSTIFYSTNAGAGFINGYSSGIPAGINLVSVFAITKSKVLVTGSSGNITYVYRTTNMGANWTQVFSQTNGRMNGFWFKDTINGIMVGNPVGGRWSIWRSSSAGLNWDSTGENISQAGTESGFMNSISGYYSKYWFGTNNHHLYYTSNNGVNWNVQSTDTMQNSSAVWHWSMNPADTTMAELLTGGYGKLYVTSNFGSNWNWYQNTVSANICGITGTEIGVNTSFMRVEWVTGDNKIYSLWTGSYTSPSGNYNYIITCKNFFTDLWAVRDNGGISWDYCCSGVEKISDKVPNEFSLSQNYPNPFNPSTIIKYEITKSSFVELKVFDATGHQIASLVSEQQTPGTYETEFDGSGYASGVYFYKLISDEFTETKRMVLIK